MKITRRSLLATSGAAILSSTLPRRGWTETRVELDGGIEILTLSDGNLTLPAEFIFGPMPGDELAAVLARFDMDPSAPLTPPCNITLLRHGDTLALFDAGSGTAFQSSVGALPDALAAAGIDPLDITHVIFTHGHPDHLWGALDDFDEALFADATHMMGRIEFDYWMDDATVESIGAERASFAVGAKRRLEILADDMVLFDDGASVLPGVTALLTPGHTPGHMAFVIGEGAQAVMVLGDAIGNGHIAFARPEWTSGSDQDPEMAAATRGRLFAQITAADMTVIGFHLPGGGIGRVVQGSDGFTFQPEM
ncbi:MBL fold metallo-hydrolase [Roseicyclus sp.]|uniref:MBL fold metallo-hydrolase n=1 Tax=Roseicyclus sp. TaxID=1914329 RepID=UPI003F6BABC4